MTLSVHTDNKKEYTLTLGNGPADSLDDTTLIAQEECSINFTDQQKKFCLNLNNNGIINNYIFVNNGEIYKAKDS